MRLIGFTDGVERNLRIGALRGLSLHLLLLVACRKQACEYLLGSSQRGVYGQRRGAFGLRQQPSARICADALQVAGSCSQAKPKYGDFRLHHGHLTAKRSGG
jgi:hypothetical protein